MAAFKKLAQVAALAGLLAGLFLTLIQQVQIVPLILKAEHYEQAAAVLNHLDHLDDSWQPEDGWQRNAFTAAANSVIAFGFALLLGAAITLRKARLDGLSGLFWGLGGFAVFFLAPSLGLPPEVPGAESAALLDRQLWWLFTVIATSIGLWLAFFSDKRAIQIIGVVLLIVPHWIGAPEPLVQGGTAPLELEHAFRLAAAITNLLFWMALGSLFGFFHRRWA